MAEFPAMPLWTDAYIADTQHLTNEEHGVYLRLLMFAWRSPDCRLPNDDKRLAIMVGVTPRVWSRLRPIIMAFWTLDNGRWFQKKLLSERKYVEQVREQKRSAGIASAKAKSLKSNNQGSTGVITARSTERQQNVNTHTHTHTRGKNDPQGSSKKDDQKPKRKTGHRLPNDWQPTTEFLDFAITEGFTHEQAIRESKNFHDYWISKAGANATKLDWLATWRNWIRRSDKKTTSRGNARPSTAREDLYAGFAAVAADDNAGIQGNNGAGRVAQEPSFEDLDFSESGDIARSLLPSKRQQ